MFHLIANWKMHLVNLDQYASDLQITESVKVVLCPTYVQLANLGALLTNNISLGAQDCHYENIVSGNRTGAISPYILKSIGCEYVIIGHSERRQYYQESDKTIKEKILAAWQADLKVILCVGEHEGEVMEQILDAQLAASLPETGETAKLLIAYEPIWAIGSGKTPTHAAIIKAVQFIKQQLSDNITVLYGGSVNPNNAGDIANLVNGLLIGKASLDSAVFNQIITEVS
jgi:triosephosphate isomerase